MTASIDIPGTRMRRLEELLPDLRKHKIEKTPIERIEALELAMAYLKSKIADMDSKNEL